MDFFVRLGTLFRDAHPRFAAALAALDHGAAEVMGGLLQALSPHFRDAKHYGLRVVQLKRALRGAAFARGALFPLQPTLSAEKFGELSRTLQQLATDIVSELGRVRSERNEGD
jgi:hypothetical protein